MKQTHDILRTMAHRAVLMAVLLLTSHGLMASDFELPPPPAPYAATNPPAIRVDWIQGAIDKSQMPKMPQMPVLPSMDVLERDSFNGSRIDTSKTRELAAAVDPGIEAMLQAVKSEAPGRSTLEGMLFEQLRSQLPQRGDGYIFDKVMMPGNIELPNNGCRIAYSFRLPNQGIGSTPFSASVTDKQGQVTKRFSGSVYLDREARGVQVGRRIRQGQRIAPGDLVVVDGRLSQIPRGTFEDASRVEGTLARNELRPGQWLTDRLVETPDMVKRGQAVTMRLERGMLKISAPAIVRQDGGPGELIRVQNAQSGKELFAKVISKDEVQVIF